MKHEKWKRHEKWTIGIAITSLVISTLVAIIIPVWIHVTSQPHTQFEETCKKLELLDSEINETEQQIEDWNEERPFIEDDLRSNDPDFDAEAVLTEAKKLLQNAKTLRDNARESLIEGHYSAAEDYILASHQAAEQVALPYLSEVEGALLWWVIILPTAAGMVGLLAYFIIRRAKARPQSGINVSDQEE